MAKRFVTAFAEAGDRAVMPDAPVSSESNYQTGYTPEYEQDPAANPTTAKFVERDKSNQLYNDITANIKEWQEHGFPEFITSANNGGVPFSYKKNSIVTYLGVDYISKENVNEDVPPSSKWEVYDLILINDLSQSHEFATEAAYKAFTHAFPIGKVIHLLDRQEDFIVEAGTGSGDDAFVIANVTTGQSARLDASDTVTTKSIGITSAATDQSVKMQIAVDYCQANGIKNLTLSTAVLLNNRVDYNGVASLHINLNKQVLTVNNSIASDPHLAAGFYMTGGVGTASLTIGNGKYNGDNSFSLLVASSILYQNLGWAVVGGYAARAIDDLNYTTNRGACVMYDIEAVDSLGMVHFLTNTPTKTANVKTKNVTNTTNVGVFTARNTESVEYDDLYVEGFNGKAYNVSYVRNPVYGTLRTKEKLQALGAEEDLSFYFGHFCGVCNAGQLLELGQIDGSLKGSSFKASYWVESVHVEHLQVNSAHHGAFVQGVRKATFGSISGECEQRATYTFAHTTHGAISNGYIDFGSVDVVTGDISAATLAHQFDSVKDDPVDLTVIGALRHDIKTCGKVFYNEAAAKEGAKIQVESVGDGTGGTGNGNGKAIYVDRMPAYFTLDYEIRCPDVEGGTLAHFDGRSRNVELDIIARGLSSPLALAHTVPTGFNELNFRYVGLLSNWDTSSPQEVLFGTSTVVSARMTPSYCKQIGAARPNGSGKGIHEFYDQNITKKIFNDYDNATGWVDAQGVSV